MLLFTQLSCLFICYPLLLLIFCLIFWFSLIVLPLIYYIFTLPVLNFIDISGCRHSEMRNTIHCSLSYMPALKLKSGRRIPPKQIRNVTKIWHIPSKLKREKNLLNKQCLPTVESIELHQEGLFIFHAGITIIYFYWVIFSFFSSMVGI